MKMLVILQGPAYGDERAYNGLRLAGNLAKRDDVEVKVFCFGDAVGCAVAGQQLPNGYYHLDRMITSAARHGADTFFHPRAGEEMELQVGRLLAAVAPPEGASLDDV